MDWDLVFSDELGAGNFGKVYLANVLDDDDVEVLNNLFSKVYLFACKRRF